MWVVGAPEVRLADRLTVSDVSQLPDDGPAVSMVMAVANVWLLGTLCQQRGLRTNFVAEEGWDLVGGPGGRVFKRNSKLARGLGPAGRRPTGPRPRRRRRAPTATGRGGRRGRLDPPLRLVGDEIANVAPLPKLPDLGTDACGFGMQLVLALQSFAQARRRWGADGARALMDNMPAELLLGGFTDTDALGRYSALVGDVELTRATTSYDQATGRMTSSSEQLADRKVMRAGEARQIPDGHALLIYRNRGAVLLRMTPWYERPDAKTLTADRDTVEARRLANAAAARS